TQHAQPAKYRVLEDLVLFRHPRNRRFTRDDLARGLAHRHAIAVRRTHHHAFDPRLPADEGFLAALEHRHHLDMRGKAQETTQGHHTPQIPIIRHPDRALTPSGPN